MKRNNQLPKIKEFKYKSHFYRHKNDLLKAIFPEAEIVDKQIIRFKQPNFYGIIADVNSDSIHLEINSAFKKQHDWLKSNQNVRLEVVNTSFQYTASSGKGYLYPWDRDMFEDSELGMEQKAQYFVLVLQVCLNHIINQ